MRFLTAATAALSLAATLLITPTTASAVPVLQQSSASSRSTSSSGSLVWTRRGAEGSEHLVIAGTDGSSQRDLTTARPNIQDQDAQISPDGRWIAFARVADVDGGVYLIRPNGRDEHRLLDCVDPCVGLNGPTWLSRNRLAFDLVLGPFDANGTAKSDLLYTARIDGTHLRRFSQPGIDGVYEDSQLRISRDHSFVIFRRFRNSDGEAALFRARSDGSHVRQLTQWSLSPGTYDLSTARSGRTKDLIVFDSTGRGDPDQTFIDIATVPASCGSLRACTAQIRWLTDNAATGRRDVNPQWSPNGRRLVFTGRPSVQDQNAEIYTMRFAWSTKKAKDVSQSPAFDYRPTWGVTARCGHS